MTSPHELAAALLKRAVDDAYVDARTAKHRQHGIFFGQW